MKKLSTSFQRNRSNVQYWIGSRIQNPGSLGYYDTNSQLQVQLVTVNHSAKIPWSLILPGWDPQQITLITTNRWEH